jgi:hypothetical protein
LGATSKGPFKRQDPEIDGAETRRIKSGGRLSSHAALNIFSIWAELLEGYSALAQTKPEDKRIAFSGIAKKMKLTLNDEYLAGLWKRHLPYHLL